MATLRNIKATNSIERKQNGDRKSMHIYTHAHGSKIGYTNVYCIILHNLDIITLVHKLILKGETSTLLFVLNVKYKHFISGISFTSIAVKLLHCGHSIYIAS